MKTILPSVTIVAELGLSDEDDKSCLPDEKNDNMLQIHHKIQKVFYCFGDGRSNATGLFATEVIVSPSAGVDLVVPSRNNIKNKAHLVFTLYS